MLRTRTDGKSIVELGNNNGIAKAKKIFTQNMLRTASGIDPRLKNKKDNKTQNIIGNRKINSQKMESKPPNKIKMPLDFLKDYKGPILEGPNNDHRTHISFHNTPKKLDNSSSAWLHTARAHEIVSNNDCSGSLKNFHEGDVIKTGSSAKFDFMYHTSSSFEYVMRASFARIESHHKNHLVPIVFWKEM